MILTAEGFAANVARVGPLVRVRPLVDEQIVGFGELAVAELADELLLGAGSAAGRSGRDGGWNSSATGAHEPTVERRREDGRKGVVAGKLRRLRARWRREYGKGRLAAQSESRWWRKGFQDSSASSVASSRTAVGRGRRWWWMRRWWAQWGFLCRPLVTGAQTCGGRRWGSAVSTAAATVFTVGIIEIVLHRLAGAARLWRRLFSHERHHAHRTRRHHRSESGSFAQTGRGSRQDNVRIAAQSVSWRSTHEATRRQTRRRLFRVGHV